MSLLVGGKYTRQVLKPTHNCKLLLLFQTDYLVKWKAFYYAKTSLWENYGSCLQQFIKYGKNSIVLTTSNLRFKFF